MVRMLVVDDEEVIRKGIMESIDWSVHGIDVAGEAANGREALALAKELKPEIVIADIRMPVMDGLELARHLKELMPSVRLVILTGYGEFEFAKKAIELKVSEFVLKPVGAEELVNVVLKLKDEILVEKRKTETRKSYERLLKENLPLIRGRFINSLISNAYNPKDRDRILKRLDTLGMELSGPYYQVFILAIDDYFFRVGNQSPENRELLFDAVLGIADEAMSTYTKGYICRNEMGLFVGLVNTGKQTMAIEAICRQIQYLLDKHLKISVSMGIGNEKKDICSVSESYNEAFNALRSRVYRGKNVIIHINDVAEESGGPAGMAFLQSCSKEEKELRVCLKLIDKNKVDSLLDGLFDRLVSMKAGYGSIKNIAHYLLLAAVKYMEEMGISIEDRLEIQLDPFAEIEKYETVEDIKKWMKDVLGRFIDIAGNEKNEKYKSIVKIGMDYIVRHYHEAVTLTIVAKKVHVTPNYFSRVFRKETGENFIEWLNKYRIEKAKEYMKDVSLKTYEVAEKVGFNDYKSFSYNFKKYAGCSTTDYREQRAKG